MKLEILQVLDCPNVALLEQRLTHALADHTDAVEITHRVIDDPAAAAAAGMHGSPTLLIDGHAPSRNPGSHRVCRVACIPAPVADSTLRRSRLCATRCTSPQPW